MDRNDQTKGHGFYIGGAVILGTIVVFVPLCVLFWYFVYSRDFPYKFHVVCYIFVSSLFIVWPLVKFIAKCFFMTKNPTCGHAMLCDCQNFNTFYYEMIDSLLKVSSFVYSPPKTKKVFESYDIVDPLSTLSRQEQDILFQMRDLSSNLSVNPDDAAFMTDHTLYRFLKARKWVVVDALNLLTEAIAWRSNLKPWLVQPSDFVVAGKQKFIFADGFDRRSRPILYLMMGRDKLDNSLENQVEKLKLLVYWMERCCTSMENGVTQCTFVIDLKNANISWDTINQLKGLFGNWANAYPERLGLCLITNVSWGLMSLWYIVQGLLSEQTLAKFKHLSNDPNEMIDEFEEHIPLDQLLTDFGGKSTFLP
jgi:hypothetical protein